MTGTSPSSSSSSSSSHPPSSFASFIFLDDVSGRLAPAEQIKFVCSYGGRILPRRPDGKLRYVGGHTRVVSVRRSLSFSDLERKLRELSRCRGAAVSLRCQLPTLDLDALVSVTSDADLHNLIDEYAAVPQDVHSPLRIRAFLFFPPSRPWSPSAASAASSSSFSTPLDNSSPSTSPPPPAALFSHAVGRELRSSRRPPLVPAPRVRRQKNPAATFVDLQVAVSSPKVSGMQNPAAAVPAAGGFGRNRRLQADRQSHRHCCHGTSRACRFHAHH